MIPQFDNVKELFKFLEKYESDTRVSTDNKVYDGDKLIAEVKLNKNK